MRVLLFCLPIILLLQVFHLCSAENGKDKESSFFDAKERMVRLTDKLLTKFVRKGEKLSKLFEPEKGIKEHRDTKDVNLLKFVASISGFHSKELHKKLGKQNSKEAIEHNKTAIHKFIARIYAMIMDALIDQGGHRFREFVPLFEQLRAFRKRLDLELEKFDKEDKGHHKNLDEAPAPMQKGESVYHLFLMPTESLAEINKANKPAAGEYVDGYNQIVKIMNFISAVIHNDENGGQHILAKATKFISDMLKNDQNDIFEHPEKFQELFEKNITDEHLRKIFRILAKNAGYDVKKYDVKKAAEKEKLKRKLVKMLTDLYLCIWNSEIYGYGTYKIYGKIYNDLMKVKDYYVKEHKMDWEKEVKDAKEDLDKRLDEKLRLKKSEKEKYGEFSEKWSWIYACDNFWDKMWEEENGKNEQNANKKQQHTTARKRRNVGPHHRAKTANGKSQQVKVDPHRAETFN